MPYQCISIADAKELMAAGSVTLLDIRDAASFAAGHIEDSINVNNDNVEAVIAHADKNKPLLVCCYHGNSSKGAADYFHGAGFTQSYSIDGGYEMWKQTS